MDYETGNVKSAPKPEFDRYEIEDAARTLVRAEEIKLKPKLLKAARQHLKNEQKAKANALSNTKDS